MGIAAYFASLDISTLPGRIPGGVAQGMIWGLMALGVYITFRVLNTADMTVDGSFATGGACAVMLITGGCPASLALLAATDAFPWETVCRMRAPVSTFFMQIQFPWRLVSMAVPLLSLAAAWGYLAQPARRAAGMAVILVLSVMAGGYTMHLPTEDKSYQSRNEMREELIVLLGGRVAEALVLDDISTGASNDIERATKIVRAMVTKYGMSDRLGPITYGADSSNPFLGKEMGHVSNYSEETAAEIDEEIKSIICDAYDKTKKVLSEHIDLLHRLAGVLFEREKLDADEFLDVMNGKLLPSAQTAAAGIIPAEAAAPETTELPTEAQTEPEANTNE